MFRPTLPFLRTCPSLSKKLYDWKEDLSEDLDLKPSSRKSATPQRLMLELAYWCHFILLHHHFDNNRTRSGTSSEEETVHTKVKMTFLISTILNSRIT